MNDKKIRKKEFLDAALKLFSNNGYEKTKIIDIANNANVGKGTIYEYFKDKHNLFDEVINSRLTLYYKDSTILMDENLSPKEKLSHIIHLESTVIERDLLFFKLLTQIFAQPVNYKEFDIHRALHTFQLTRLNNLKSILSEGVKTKDFRQINIDVVALSILSSLNTYVISKYSLHPGTEVFPVTNDLNSDDLLDFIMNGLT